MLSLNCVKKTRAFLSPLFVINKTIIYTFSSFSYTTQLFIPSTNALPTVLEGIDGNVQTKDVALSLKEWFKSHSNACLDRIYEILSTHDAIVDSSVPRTSADLALSQLGLRLSEGFVLEVLNYGKDVVSCLKFFDWAGRQPGFHHTRATFNAIFKILSRAKQTSLMLDFIGNYMKQRHFYRVQFYNTLVMGYAIVGKPDIALQLFGKMRFQGLDLDEFSYHVLLNALVEESCFDVVEVITKQINMRGFENDITHSIMMKNFCKQNRLEDAEAFLRDLMSSGRELSEHVVSVLVGALCKSNKFDRAGKLVEEVRMEHVYGVWIRNLVKARKLDGALEFFQTKKLLEGYVPDVFRYNILICRLLRENRLGEVFDLLMEMKESQITPDKVTMNAALCFFCKAGKVDSALELYKSRADIGLSPNSMAYNFLINTLCGDGSVDEAYLVLKNSINQGYFPGKKTFSIIADALCREGKLDKMKELLLVALERNVMPSASTYDMFISALCRARRVEDGYLIHGELNRIKKITTKRTYYNLIHGFNKSNRGDIAARLLIEMQERGHSPTKSLFRPVIRCLCEMDNPEKQFLKLLEMQLSVHEPDCWIYNIFIDGAGHAKKPDLAREVFEMMGRNEIVPNLSSDILMLQSYLRSDRISDALNFFNDLRKRRMVGRKLYNIMVVGLCKANKPDLALEFLREIRENRMVPSLECYEMLVMSLCSHKRYDTVVHLIYDLEKVGRRVSSFIGNVLLLHSLKSQNLYESWVRLSNVHDETSCSSGLGQLIGVFSGRLRVTQHIDLEEMIGECFPLDIYTYNMLLRRLSMSDIDLACGFFKRMCDKGYVPNRWTYDILVHGLFRHGKTDDAKRWVEAMYREGFNPTKHTISLI